MIAQFLRNRFADSPVRFAGMMTWLAASIACPMGMRGDIEWAQPERFRVTPGATLRISLFSAPAFDQTGRPVSAERVAQQSGVLGDQPVAAAPVPMPTGVAVATTLKSTQGISPRWMVTLPRPGVALLAADLKPSVRELQRDEVEPYLRDVYAGDDIRATWAARAEEGLWRERRSVRVKTCIRVGEPAEMSPAIARAMPRGLDLLPLSDPTGMREGGRLTVQVVYDGAPVAGTTVGFLSHGLNREHAVIADADGRASAPCDAVGLWIVRAYLLRPTAAADHEWEAETVVLSFEVR